ncbi:MAG: SDR family NAD(P)-dependent oxidoreductase [Thermoanaerobaculales bacterium]
MDLSKEVILVTGGSRGIGRAVVERLSRAGETVAFTWRSEKTRAREIEDATDGTVRAFHLDLSDRARPRVLVEEVEAEMGPIAGLVNNAGIERSELLALTSDDSWDTILDINLGGAFRMSREVLRSMVRHRRGCIVNVASLSALHGVAGHSAYGASKAGLLAVTRCLARELGRFGIRVNAVVPGLVPTDMTAGLPKEAGAQLRARECLPDGITPHAVAEVIAFLLSRSAAGITGQSLPVDAGTSA